MLEMIKYYTLSLLFFTNLATAGLWIDSKGQSKELPCPTTYSSQAGAIRLPKGCYAPVPGFLMSLPDYEKTRSLLAALKKDRDSCRTKDLPSRDLTIKQLKKINEDFAFLTDTLEAQATTCNDLYSYTLDNLQPNISPQWSTLMFILGAGTTSAAVWLSK